MNDCLETRICETSDNDFRSLVVELIHCVGWEEDADKIERYSLAHFLMAIGRDGKTLTLQHLPVNGILNEKVNKLPYDSMVHQVCRELARCNGMPIESFDGKAVLTLIKRCHKFFCPKPYKKLRSKKRPLS